MPTQLVFTCTILTALIFGAAPARGLQPDNPVVAADQEQIYSYRLTMDKIQKTATATKALEEFRKHHPKMKKALEWQSIDGAVQDIQRYPEAVAAITSSGLTPHEYVVCLMTVTQASTAVGLKKSGKIADYSRKILRFVSRDNLYFTEQHWSEIQKLTQTDD